MSVDQFLALQFQLFQAYGPAINWWLIMFLVSGVGLAGLIFALVIARGFLDRS